MLDDVAGICGDNGLEFVSYVEENNQGEIRTLNLSKKEARNL